MGIREKLLDFKRRLSDRRMYSIVIIVIGAVALWGFYQYKHSANLRQELDNQYNRAFFDMVGYVNNVETLLMKSMITSTPDKTAATLQEAWRQANLAQTDLGQLPISQQVLANTSKFLTQVGDFSYSLNNQNMTGKPLNDQQYKTLEQLHGYSVSLGKSLSTLQNQLTVGRLKWGDLTKKGAPLFGKKARSMMMQQIESIDKTFQKYPTLIYDGPFSDHMATAVPKGVTGDKLNTEQAKKIAMNFIGANKIGSIAFVRKNDAGPIKTYSFNITFKNAPKGQIGTIDITQTGGFVYQYLRNRAAGPGKIGMDKAKTMGRDFLEKNGYKNMVDTYYLKQGNTATINYAYKQDNTTVYPDLIKVKIALDNGEVIGVESKSYLAAHTNRTIPAPKITMQQARSLVSHRVKINAVDMAIIPTDYKTELFTYELKGKMGNKDFIVYINAINGREENILMIVNTPNGVLTM